MATFKAKYTTIQLLLNRLGAQQIFTIKQDFFLSMLRSVRSVGALALISPSFSHLFFCCALCCLREPTARNAASKVVESFLGSLYAELKKETTQASEADILVECRKVRPLFLTPVLPES